jgi:peptidoglycan-N-acetylglucosamine deacetylase
VLLIVGCLVAVGQPRPPAHAGRPAGSRIAVRARLPAPAAGRPSAGRPSAARGGVQRRVPARAGAVALSFDDGPDPRWTPVVLDLLRRYRVRATFCLVGEHVAEHPELVRRVAADGQVLCDHTWSHDEALPTRSPATIRAEIGRTYDAIVAASGGIRPRYYRAPGGRWSPAVLAEARRLGLRPLGWSVDPADWRRPPAALITQRVLEGAAPGAVVLLHDGYGNRAATVAALREILPALAARHVTSTIP